MSNSSNVLLALPEGTFAEALTCFNQRDFTAAQALCMQLVSAQPHHCDAHHLLGVIHLHDGRATEAVTWLKRATNLGPQQAEIQVNLGNALAAAGLYEDAVLSFDRALLLNPEHAGCWNNRGHALLTLGKYEKALLSFDRALRIQPNHVRACNNRGTALLRLQRFDAALAAFEQACQLAPDYAEAWCNVGIAQVALRNGDAGLAAFNRALDLTPDLFDALLGRAELLVEARRPDLALPDFHAALRSKPEDPRALTHAGNALLATGRVEEALACYDAALRITPDNPAALTNRGNALTRLLRYEEALRAFDDALALEAAFANALNSKASLLHTLGRTESTRECIEQLYAADPNFAYMAGAVLNFRLQQCNWQDYDLLHGRVLKGLAEERMIDMPFPFLAVSDSPELQLRCGRIYTQDQCAVMVPRHQAMRRHERLRLAYVSADLRKHAVSQLMSGVFREHDRSRFELIAVALHPQDDSDFSRQLRDSFEQFHVVQHWQDQQIAQLLRDLEVDIAVDLMGHTQYSRPSIFALRPAPVQIQHLGFPGTMGAPFMDYLIADEFLVPEAERTHYSEALILLPHCFQSNDERRDIDPHLPSRAAVGLPDQGFVFCSFNNSYKINPQGFASWMRILGRVPDSVLWLVANDEVTRDNLRRAAAGQGIDGNRLVFAPRIEYAQHLARMQRADLFLDTLPFNAGATASDALWAGVPLLTCPGRTYAARMAGSLLHALDMSELVTNSPGEYEELAVSLALDPQRLRQLRDKLATQRLTQPLFQTRPHTRALEVAYEMAFESAVRGEAPATFNVPAT